MFQLQPRQIILAANQVSDFVDYSILNNTVALTGFRPANVVIHQGLQDDLIRAIDWANVRAKVAELLTNLSAENPGAQEAIRKFPLDADCMGLGVTARDCHAAGRAKAGRRWPRPNSVQRNRAMNSTSSTTNASGIGGGACTR